MGSIPSDGAFMHSTLTGFPPGALERRLNLLDSSHGLGIHRTGSLAIRFVTG